MLFSSSSFYLARTISSIQVLFNQRLFSSCRLYLSYVVFTIQLVLKLCCFDHPASTLQRTISSSQVLFKQRSFSSSSFYFAKNYCGEIAFAGIVWVSYRMHLNWAFLQYCCVCLN